MEKDENIKCLTDYIKVDESLENNDELVRIIKGYWLLLFPSKLERWLEDMEMEGYKLHRIALRGLILYFKKNESSKTQYFTDFLPYVNKQYFESFIKIGWKPIHYMWIDGIRMIIWRKASNDIDNTSKFVFLKQKKVRDKTLMKRILYNVILASAFCSTSLNMVFTLQRENRNVDLGFIIMNTILVAAIIISVCKLIGVILYLLKIRRIDQV
ncbi:DUF2812 domain-containing protein [Clostridium folliculivorans]|uniref:DUF2812 domain-containing protein n=1 Tax=Clostridium folliculivorans TaxID=2886038 RepID=A0A9W6DAP5_9CLOT|nr:DUF2812 domain-containing protein [Clostridium folliculivorans]GKU25037.1 hypothetical protein CFOLD11_18630 [Clostridium folliculivorans]GKU31135.1 hypothetical protein CFB3_32420 [Clostridium folliculivorans]